MPSAGPGVQKLMVRRSKKSGASTTMSRPWPPPVNKYLLIAYNLHGTVFGTGYTKSKEQQHGLELQEGQNLLGDETYKSLS